MFQGVSKTNGPIWDWSYDGLNFDMPFTRTRIETGPLVPAAFSWMSSILFCFLVIVVFPAIKPNNKETIKKIAFYHYVGLFLYSLFASVAAFYVMFTNGVTDLNNLESFYCDQVPDWFRVVSISFMLSKYWEWLDTAILVWNGKSLYDIGFLHFYHHMTTVWVFSLTANFPGMFSWGVTLFSPFSFDTLSIYHITTTTNSNDNNNKKKETTKQILSKAIWILPPSPLTANPHLLPLRNVQSSFLTITHTPDI